VVHGSVVEAVAVDRSADADVIEMCGEDDKFVLELWIGAGKFCDKICGFDVFGLYSDVSLDGDGEWKARKWSTVFGNRSKFGERLSGTGEKFIGGCRIKKKR